MFFDEEYIAARRVLELANLLISTRNKDIKKLDMTTDQADALIFFNDFPKSSISDLKDFQHIKHQSAQKITQHLAEKGLITLATNTADRRAKIVVLTHSGHLMREKIKNNGSHTGQRLLNNFSVTQKKEFLRLIEKSINNMRGEKDETKIL